MVSEGPGVVSEEHKACELISRPWIGSKGPHTGFRDGPNKTGLKETSEGPKPKDLRPISQGPRLMVSEGLGPGLKMFYTALRLRWPWPGLRKTWDRS